jgi:hypothetical protein
MSLRSTEHDADDPIASHDAARVSRSSLAASQKQSHLQQAHKGKRRAMGCRAIEAEQGIRNHVPVND